MSGVFEAGESDAVERPVPLAWLTDFYRAWEMVDAADPAEFSAPTRARAFASWVGLFGFIDHNNMVTLNMEVVAERFALSRATWVLYRRLLTDVGLIEQERSKADRRPTFVRLLPPRL